MDTCTDGNLGNYRREVVKMLVGVIHIRVPMHLIEELSRDLVISRVLTLWTRDFKTSYCILSLYYHSCQY